MEDEEVIALISKLLGRWRLCWIRLVIDRHFGASLILGSSRFLIIFGMFMKIGWKWTGDSIFFRPFKPILSHFKIRKNWKMIYLGILNQFSLELKSPLGEKRRTETLCKSTITKLCISTAWHYPQKTLGWQIRVSWVTRHFTNWPPL